jgi:eukaryotic-like serine/threonine-protein kinase
LLDLHLTLERFGQRQMQDANAYALDRTTGAVVWTHDFIADAPPDQPGFDGKNARIGSAVARPNDCACDGELFIQSVFDQSRVIAIDCANGKRRWAFQTGGWISPAPTIAGDHVFVVSQDKYLYCLDRATGQLAWKFKAPSWLASRAAVHDGKVFLACHSGQLIQLDEKSGKRLQTFRTADPADAKTLVYSFPILTDRIAYMAVGKGQLYAVGIEKSDLKWKLRVSESSELFTNPATDGQRIFVTSRKDIKGAGEHAIVAIGKQP